MNAQWKKFTGSGEQISEILNANKPVILKLNDGKEISFLFDEDTDGFKIEFISINQFVYYKNIGISGYMIGQPHPHADMIIEWARTGREVYRKCELGQWHLEERPIWHPRAEYSFNVPTESGENVNPSNTSLPCDGDGK